MDALYTVILIRGVKGWRKWDHNSYEAAIKRAEALGELHGAPVLARSGVFIIDAAKFYSEARDEENDS